RIARWNRHASDVVRDGTIGISGRPRDPGPARTTENRIQRRDEAACGESHFDSIGFVYMLVLLAVREHNERPVQHCGKFRLHLDPCLSTHHARAALIYDEWRALLRRLL